MQFKSGVKQQIFVCLTIRFSSNFDKYSTMKKTLEIKFFGASKSVEFAIFVDLIPILLIVPGEVSKRIPRAKALERLCVMRLFSFVTEMQYPHVHLRHA